MQSHRLSLEGLDSLDVSIHVIRQRLEVFQDFLCFINDSWVFLYNRAVVGKVDSGGLASYGIGDTLGLAVSFSEGL
jgi:hypothetical protein